MLNIIFQFMVFLAVFSFVCCLQYQNQPQFNNFWLDEVKQAFSSEYEPESEEIAIALLPPTRERRHNQTEPILNEIIIPVSSSAAEKKEAKKLPPNPTLSQLKNYIAKNNLQLLIRQTLGKPLSKCKKSELLRVIFL